LTSEPSMRRPWKKRRRWKTGWARRRRISRRVNSICALAGRDSAQLTHEMLVVLAVGVVVALLGPPDLVAGEQHRHALGEEERGRGSSGPFRSRSAMIAGSSVGPSDPQFQDGCPSSVPVLLAVGLVVLVVVADEIEQREAVVGGHEVDAGRRPAAARLVEVAEPVRR
jgi:hypothetical protein